MSKSIPPLPPGGEQLVLGDASYAAKPWLSFSDGSVKKSRAAAAFVLYGEEGTALDSRGWSLSGSTRDSNVPELEGLLAGVERAAQAGATSLVCLTDSYQAVQALIRSAAGATAGYPAIDRLLALAKLFRRIEFRNIERRHNKEADQLCLAYR